MLARAVAAFHLSECMAVATAGGPGPATMKKVAAFLGSTQVSMASFAPRAGIGAHAQFEAVGGESGPDRDVAPESIDRAAASASAGCRRRGSTDGHPHLSLASGMGTVGVQFDPWDSPREACWGAGRRPTADKDIGGVRVAASHRAGSGWLADTADHGMAPEIGACKPSERCPNLVHQPARGTSGAVRCAPEGASDGGDGGRPPAGRGVDGFDEGLGLARAGIGAR